MGFDQVTWTPAYTVGGAPPANYNLSGATWLDGSVDTGTATPVGAGDSSGFSATPTIAQINASSDLNQVIGLYNRRALQYNSLFGTALGTLSYIAVGASITATSFTNIQTAINNVRAAEGFAAYSFGAGVVAASPVLGRHLSDLRKALGIYGVLTKNQASSPAPKPHGYERRDIPYLTGNSEDALTNTAGHGIGKKWGGGTETDRLRELTNYQIPDWCTTGISTASISYPFTPTATTLEALTVEVYQSNTDDHTATLIPAYGGSAYNTNTLIGSSAASPVSCTLVAADLYARAGIYLSIIAGQALEIAGAGSATNSTHESYGSGANPVLTIDFG